MTTFIRKSQKSLSDFALTCTRKVSEKSITTFTAKVSENPFSEKQDEGAASQRNKSQNTLCQMTFLPLRETGLLSYNIFSETSFSEKFSLSQRKL